MSALVLIDDPQHHGPYAECFRVDVVGGVHPVEAKRLLAERDHPDAEFVAVDTHVGRRSFHRHGPRAKRSPMASSICCSMSASSRLVGRSRDPRTKSSVACPPCVDGSAARLQQQA